MPGLANTQQIDTSLIFCLTLFCARNGYLSAPRSSFQCLDLHFSLTQGVGGLVNKTQELQ